MAESFPLDRYLDASRTLALDEFDWSLATKYPLAKDVERALVYMLRIEAQTLFYVRDLLNTRTAYLPEVSSFLTAWLYEEERHSRMFRRFLKERGVHLADDDRAIVRKASSHGVREWFEATAARWLARTTEHFVAVHMIWGATQELSTLHAYERVAARCNHPLLSELCQRIAKDERRHFAFYFNMAERLLEPRAAQHLSRFILDRWWQPVGMGVHASQHVHFMVDWFYGDAEEKVRQMDTTIDRLPGFAGLRLYERAVARAKEAVARGKAKGSRFEDWVYEPVLP
jgi:rubrerythrin